MKASVLITGTSRGMGLETVKQLCQATDWVDKIYATARNENDALKALITAHPQVKFIQLDQNNEASIKKACAEVAKDLGNDRGLNYVINNAAVACFVGIEDVKAEDINSVMNTNVTGPTIIIKELLPLLKRAHEKGGTALVINYGSYTGSFDSVPHWNLPLDQPPNLFIYRMSKVAVHMMSYTLDHYLGSSGINFITYHPGWVKTDMGSNDKGMLTAEFAINKLLLLMRKPTPEMMGKLVDYDLKVLPW